MSTAGLSAQKLPMPFKIIGGILALILAISLSRWMGNASFTLAVAMWAVALVGLFHASEQLPFSDKFPWATRLLDAYAPRARSASPATAKVKDKGDRVSHEEEVRKRALAVSRLKGIEGPLAELTHLVEGRGLRANSLHPATTLLLIGPRGTGKSTVARNVADRLYSASIVSSSRVTNFFDPPLGRLQDADAKMVHEKLMSAIGGVLLIDDLDKIVDESRGENEDRSWLSASDVGMQILSAAKGHPGQLFILGTGTLSALKSLDPKERWLDQLGPLIVEFPELDRKVLAEIALQLLTEQGFILGQSELHSLRNKIVELFDFRATQSKNAIIIRDLVTSILQNRQARLAAGIVNPTGTGVTAADIERAKTGISG